MPEAAPAPGSPPSDLKLRVMSALVLAPAVLAATWWGGWPFALIWLVAAAFVTHEFLTMPARGAIRPCSSPWSGSCSPDFGPQDMAEDWPLARHAGRRPAPLRARLAAARRLSGGVASLPGASRRARRWASARSALRGRDRCRRRPRARGPRSAGRAGAVALRHRLVHRHRRLFRRATVWRPEAVAGSEPEKDLVRARSPAALAGLAAAWDRRPVRQAALFAAWSDSSASPFLLFRPPSPRKPAISPNRR